MTASAFAHEVPVEPTPPPPPPPVPPPEGDPPAIEPPVTEPGRTPPVADPPPGLLNLGRVHARRLRDVYRSAGWPCCDPVEVDLLAAGLLERMRSVFGHETLRVTDRGIAHIAGTLVVNRAALSAHEALVERVAREMTRGGRIAWRGLTLRARLPAMEEGASRAGASRGPTCSRSATPASRRMPTRSCTRSRSAGPTCSATCARATNAPPTSTWAARILRCLPQ